MTLVDQEAPQKEEISLRDELRSALAAAKAQPVEVEEAPEETAEAKAEWLRDESGRFVKQEASKEATEAPKVEEVKQEASAEAAQPAAPAIKAPAGWSSAMKAKFNTLPPDVQAEIARREEDTHRVITRQDDERNLGKQVREVTAPYEAILRAEGADPISAYKMFLNYAYVMRTGAEGQKAQEIANIMRAYNVNPQALLSILQNGSVQSGNGLQPSNPALETLQQRIDRLERERQAEVQERQKQEQNQLSAEIKAFADDPAHEHFETVKPKMAALLQSGQAATLQEAYEQAIWAVPEIRSTLIAQHAAPEKRLSEAKAKTDAAKRAAVSVTGGPGAAKAAQEATPDRSLRDELRAQLRAAQGRI